MQMIIVAGRNNNIYMLVPDYNDAAGDYGHAVGTVEVDLSGIELRTWQEVEDELQADRLAILKKQRAKLDAEIKGLEI